MLKDEAHSQKLADAAIGLGTDNGTKQTGENESSHTAMEGVQG